MLITNKHKNHCVVLALHVQLCRCHDGSLLPFRARCNKVGRWVPFLLGAFQYLLGKLGKLGYWVSTRSYWVSTRSCWVCTGVLIDQAAA